MLAFASAGVHACHYPCVHVCARVLQGNTQDLSSYLTSKSSVVCDQTRKFWSKGVCLGRGDARGEVLIRGKREQHIACTHTHTHISRQTLKHTQAYNQTYHGIILVNTHTRTHAHTHIHIHTHTHTHTHTGSSRLHSTTMLLRIAAGRKSSAPPPRPPPPSPPNTLNAFLKVSRSKTSRCSHCSPLH
jgi:hypothetical protein